MLLSIPNINLMPDFVNTSLCVTRGLYILRQEFFTGYFDTSGKKFHSGYAGRKIKSDARRGRYGVTRWML